MNVKAILFFICLPLIVLAQGFAGLGSDADGFAVPTPQPAFDFPRDHGPHPDYRIEWWYLTANLTAADGTNYGLQWTLFRTALSPGEAEGWASPQLWFAHAAITTPDAHFATERFARGGIGTAGVQAEPFHAWIDEWAMQGPNLNTLDLTAQGTDFAFDMALQADGPLVFHGQDGFSVKSGEGQASYYYSQPFYRISGTLTLPTGAVEVTGNAWLDREWSSQPLSDNQSGWDWFSLSFDSGDKLMGFQLRQQDGAQYSASTWIDAQGETTTYPNGAFTAKPLSQSQVAGRDVPTGWTVHLADRNLDAQINALNPQAWMPLSVPYWEGPVTISGSHTGVGYLEMTGYE